MSQQEAKLKSRAFASFLGFNLDQKGLQSLLGMDTTSGGKPKPSQSAQTGPSPEQSLREAKRLAATFANLR